MALIGYTINNEKKYFELPEDRMIVFGREEHTDFQILNDALVSREHFAIEKDKDGRFVLIELGSSNGTFLNSKKLEPNETVFLKDGDKIQVGKQVFIFYYNKPPEKKTEDIFQEVATTVISRNEKGFKTLMSELVKKAGKPNSKK